MATDTMTTDTQAPDNLTLETTDNAPAGDAPVSLSAAFDLTPGKFHGWMVIDAPALLALMDAVALHINLRTTLNYEPGPFVDYTADGVRKMIADNDASNKPADLRFNVMYWVAEWKGSTLFIS